MNGTETMEIVERPRWGKIALPLLLPGAIFLPAEVLILTGIELALIVAAAEAIVLFIAGGFGPMCRQYSRAELSEEGMTLRPYFGGLLSMRPRFLKWVEVRKVKRYFKSIQLLAGEPVRFWSFRLQGPDKVGLSRELSHNAEIINALRAHVPAERIATGALDFEDKVLPLYRRMIGALVLLACAGWMFSATATIITGGSWFTSIWGVLGLYIGIIALLLFIRFTPVVALLIGCTFAGQSLIKGVLLFDALNGCSASSAGSLAAGGGALLSMAAIVLVGRARWRHLAIVGFCAAAAFAAGYAAFGGIPAERVAGGHLVSISSWTTNGDGFLISLDSEYAAKMTYEETAGGDFVETGPVDVQWFDKDLSAGNRLTLPEAPYLIHMGQEGAVALAKEAWFLPRRSGPAKRIGKTRGTKQSPSARFLLFRRKDEIWERFDLNSGEAKRIELPVGMQDAWGSWGKDDSTIFWIAGKSPEDRKGWLGPTSALPENGVFEKPGEKYRVWVWKEDGSNKLYEAKTEWLGVQYAGKEERVYVCRIAEEQPLRKEYVAIDFSGNGFTVEPSTEKEFQSKMLPETTKSKRYELSQRGPKMMNRVSLRDTESGKTRFLGRNPGLLGETSWSPDESMFLMTCHSFRLPSPFWRWKRSPAEVLFGGAGVYMVRVEDSMKDE